MKTETVYITSDGAQHSSLERAIRHADNRYGNALTSLAKRALQVDKYAFMCGFIEANLDEFVKLHALKDDITLVQSEE